MLCTSTYNEPAVDVRQENQKSETERGPDRSNRINIQGS